MRYYDRFEKAWGSDGWSPMAKESTAIIHEILKDKKIPIDVTEEIAKEVERVFIEYNDFLKMKVIKDIKMFASYIY